MINRDSHIGLIFFLLIVYSCKSVRSVTSEQAKILPSKEEQLSDMISDLEGAHQLFTGFVLENLQTNELIFSHNEDKFFTPASNTKLLTCLAAKKILGDSIPALQYFESHDTLFVLGTGDPSFLAHYDADSVAYKFLTKPDTKSNSILFHMDNLKSPRFGTGWAWDDFSYYYQKENTSMPFLNMATLIKTHPDSSAIDVHPAFMKEYIQIDTESASFIKRDESSNIIRINPIYKPSYSRDYEVPFYVSPNFISESLSIFLNRNIAYHEFQIDRDSFQTLYHTSADSLYKQLMLFSDNFVGEQLLFLMSNKLGVDMNTRSVIKTILMTTFKDIPDRPRWVDGSGLSRYNLITPRSLVWILKQLNTTMSKEEIEAWFPSSDHKDSLPMSLESNSLRAKTGTLSNNFCLSGFLQSKSGQTFIFSWMNNHYMMSKTELTERMSKIFTFIENNW